MLPFGLLVFSYSVAVAWIAAQLNAAPPRGSFVTVLALAGIGGVAVILPPLRRYVKTIGRNSGRFGARVRTSWRAARGDEWSAATIRENATVVALTTILITAFGTFKPLIPQLHAYTWDAKLAAIGTVLHGGHNAYTFLMPLFGSPLATRALDAFYYAGWTLVVWGTSRTAFRFSQRDTTFAIATPTSLSVVIDRRFTARSTASAARSVSARTSSAARWTIATVSMRGVIFAADAIAYS